MKYLLLLFFMALSTGLSAQISGKVIDKTTQEPVAGATVRLSDDTVNLNSVSDNNGTWAFQYQGNRNITISVSHTGYDSYSQVIQSSFTNQFVIRLSPASGTLQTVEVVGRTERKYNSNYSFGATKIAIANKDVPQAISTVTRELIQDRQAFHLADAVKIASGVTPSSYYNQYNIRGISQNEEGQIINGMRTRQYYFLQPLTSNIERVEVIKGPASATFASVDPGGSINMVTKKPLNINRREISVSAGTFSTLRGSLDFTGPLNKDSTLLYRINGAYQEAGSFRDLAGNTSFLISPSFTYLPSSATAVNIEMILSSMNGTLDRGQPIFGAVAGETKLNSTAPSLNLGAPNDFFKSKEFILMANLSHRLTKNINFIASYMKQTWTEDLQEHRTTNAFGVDTANMPVNSLAGMQFVQRKQFWNIDNISSYFNFDFKTGTVRHKLLVGYDLNSWEKRKGGGQNAARGFLLKDGTVASTFVKANLANYRLTTINGVTMPMPNVPHFNLVNPVYSIRNPSDYILNVRSELPAALTTNNALYIQELMQWNRFTLLLSLRHEWFKDITNYNALNEASFTNTAFLPRVGLTYTITKNINVYGTYLEGFQPQSNTVSLMPGTSAFFGSANSAARFKPLISDLKELGVKTDLLKNKLQMTAAFYEINQKNILMNANVPAFPDSLVNRGADRSRGFEIDVAGFIRSNWQVNASYSYTDAEIRLDSKAELIGAAKENTPRNSANLWTRYNFKEFKAIKDLGVGIGIQYSGSKIPWFVRTFKVPSYTLMDAALYYTPGKSNMQIALNVSNVFNKTYWIGAQNYLRLFPGTPRSFLLTATYKF